MPWSQLSPMDQKTQFIADYLRRSLSLTELCEHYGISRRTGYKWIERYEHGGLASLAERSRRPHVCPTQTPEEVVQALTEARLSRVIQISPSAVVEKSPPLRLVKPWFPRPAAGQL